MTGRVDGTKMISMLHFVNDDAGYLVWLSGHAGAFAINTYSSPSSAYLKLHQATCPTISRLQSGAKTSGPAVDFLAGLAGDGRVLELAIGTGRVALPLAARGITVEGVDASAAMVERGCGPNLAATRSPPPSATWPKCRSAGGRCSIRTVQSGTVDERGSSVRRLRALAGTSAETQGLRPNTPRCPPRP